MRYNLMLLAGLAVAMPAAAQDRDPAPFGEAVRDVARTMGDPAR